MNRADLFRASYPWLGQSISDYDGASRLIWSLRNDEAVNDMLVAVVRGRKMKQREGVFDQFSASLQFPYYFGENWNAFADCIRDLDWLRANAFVIVILDAEQVLVDGDADELGLLLKILTVAGEEWSKADEFRPAKPFHTLLHATPEQAQKLRARLAQIGLNVPFLESEPS